MPRGDRTGPMGLGPMTGRGGGHCAGPERPGFRSPMWNRNACGCGWGRGWRRWFEGLGVPGWARSGWEASGWGPQPYPYAAPFPSEGIGEGELWALKSQAAHLERVLEEIRRRIKDLAGGSRKE